MNHWLDRDERHCQPCGNFTNPDWCNDMTNVHECFRGQIAGVAERCSGTVSFCANCSSDHHRGGYNSCEIVSDMCPYDHPECTKRSPL